MIIDFVPVAPGEMPGDPELGGWRPLPVGVLRRRVALIIRSSPPSQAQPVKQVVSIAMASSPGRAQAVKQLGFALRYLRLKRALKILAIKLDAGPHYIQERGC